MEGVSAIDRQFRRAVEIVQGLPKTGPIQTGYEEKLAMYSLYKQATDGDVKPGRPAIWDMLGRAKWDAWEQRKGLSEEQAKMLYVEQLQKVLRKYSDRTVARDLVRELDTYNSDPSILALSGTLPRGQYDNDRSSSGSSRSASPGVVQEAAVPQLSYTPRLEGPTPHNVGRMDEMDDRAEASGSEGEGNDRLGASPPGPSTIGRPQSSASSQLRYRTPLGSTYGFTHIGASSIGLPPGQIPPRYATPSAFAGQHPGPLPPPPGSSASYPISSSFPQNLSMASGSVSGRHYPPPPSSSAAIPHRVSLSSSTPLGRSPIERAVESLQTSLAALYERIEALEHHLDDRSSPIPHPPSGPRSGYGTPQRSSYFPSTLSPSSSYLPFDPDQMGAWSVLLKPLMRLYTRFQHVIMLFTHPPNPQTNTASVIIIRRLILDTSFALFVLLTIRRAWRATGLRRQAVLRALVGLWYAAVGRNERTLVDKGV